MMNLLFLLTSYVFTLQNIRFTILEGCPSILAIVIFFCDCYSRKNLHLRIREYSLSLDFRDKNDVSIFRIRCSSTLQLERPIAQRYRTLSMKNNVIVVRLWRTTSLLFCLLKLEGVENTHQ